jgi:hypothetical protein
MPFMGRLLLAFGILLPSLVLASGCIGPLARAAIDPSGFAKEVGAQIAANSVQSLVSPNEVATVAAVEETISNIDQLIGKNPDAIWADDLGALREHMQQTADELSAEDGGKPPEIRPGEIAEGPEPPRRLGDPGPMAEQVGVMELGHSHGPDDIPDRVVDLEFDEPDRPEERLRSRDSWRFTSTSGSSLSEPEPTPEAHYRLDGGELVPNGPMWEAIQRRRR